MGARGRGRAWPSRSGPFFTLLLIVQFLLYRKLMRVIFGARAHCPADDNTAPPLILWRIAPIVLWQVAIRGTPRGKNGRRETIPIRQRADAAAIGRGPVGERHGRVDRHFLQ